MSPIGCAGSGSDASYCAWLAWDFLFAPSMNSAIMSNWSWLFGCSSSGVDAWSKNWSATYLSAYVTSTGKVDGASALIGFCSNTGAAYACPSFSQSNYGASTWSGLGASTCTGLGASTYAGFGASTCTGFGASICAGFGASTFAGFGLSTGASGCTEFACSNAAAPVAHDSWTTFFGWVSFYISSSTTASSAYCWMASSDLDSDLALDLPPIGKISLASS